MLLLLTFLQIRFFCVVKSSEQGPTAAVSISTLAINLLSNVELPTSMNQWLL